MKRNKLVLALLPLVLLCSFQPHYKEHFNWKNGAKAAICLTYDDGMQTQLDNAIPQLDAEGMKGTFFINTTDGTASIVGWTKAAKNGHELGNHSLFHPCSRATGWPEEIASENYTIPQILDEISIVNRLLNHLDPGRNTRSYGYPCNQTEVGGKSYVEALRNSGLIHCARTGGSEKKIVTPDFSAFDTLQVPSWAVPENTTLEDLVAFAEMAQEKGGMAVFQFHGVGGQWISISNEVHRGFLKYLSENRSDYWVAPFSEVVEYIERNK